MQACDLAALDLDEAIIREPIIIEPGLLVSQAIVLMSAVHDRCSRAQPEGDQVEIERLQQDARSSCLLVVEAGELIGIFTERDVVRLSALGTLRLEVCVREVMTSPVITLQKSELCDPFAVLNRFWHRRIRHLPVVDEQNNILGMVTHESLRHLLRPGHLLRSQSVFEVMSADVVSASPGISVMEAAQLLSNHRVSCLILTEEKTSEVGDLIEVATGIITERDIVQFQALELDFEALDAAVVMSSPVFSVLLNTSLWDVQQLMQRQGIRRIIVNGKDGSLQGIVTQSSLLKALSPVDLCRLVEKLKQRVAKLENDKLVILEQRALELEQEVQSRTQDLRLKVERGSNCWQRSDQRCASFVWYWTMSCRRLWSGFRHCLSVIGSPCGKCGQITVLRS